MLEPSCQDVLSGIHCSLNEDATGSEASQGDRAHTTLQVHSIGGIVELQAGVPCRIGRRLSFLSGRRKKWLKGLSFNALLLSAGCNESFNTRHHSMPFQ